MLHKCFHFLVVSLLSCLTSSPAWGQQSTYTPMRTLAPKVLLQSLDSRLEKDMKAIPSKYQNEIKEVYNNRVEILKNNISNKHYAFGNPINDYLEKILQKILVVNPSIPKEDINLLVGRYSWPNATCHGEGSIVFNIGLIRRLESEDQIAFILCHELAHYMANHVNRTIEQEVKKKKAFENSDQFEEISKQAYGRYDAILTMMQGMVYDHRRHSRLHETDADSIGMVYFLNTDYSPQEALSTMKLLDAMDEDKYQHPSNIQKWLDSPEYPFKAHWLKARKASGLSKMKIAVETTIVDSLKTHPDCTYRLELLEQQVGAQASKIEKSKADKKQLEQLIQQCDFEIVQSSFDFQNYGRCLFYAFQLLNYFPENSYLRAIIGKAFHQIYLAQKNHYLSQHIEKIGNQSKSYKEVLQFIHKLRVSEIKKLNYYFLKQGKDKHSSQEDYLYALWLSAVDMENEKEANQYKQQYLNNFPSGKYKKLLLN